MDFNNGEIVKLETNIYDKEEIIYPCTVHILTNTVTGEVSYGWWRGTPEVMLGERAESDA